jgi:hypothetical protein
MTFRIFIIVLSYKFYSVGKKHCIIYAKSIFEFRTFHVFIFKVKFLANKTIWKKNICIVSHWKLNLANDFIFLINYIIVMYFEQLIRMHEFFWHIVGYGLWMAISFNESFFFISMYSKILPYIFQFFIWKNIFFCKMKKEKKRGE